MREDAPVLLAGVASFPRHIEQKDPELYKKWESLTVEFLKREYGDNLRSIVMHNDEAKPHLHFYVYSDTQVNAKELHYGHKKRAGYIDGAKAFQDSYFEKVAIHCGMARIGPKKQRLTRAEWKAQQEHAMKIAAAESAVLDSAAQKEKEAHKSLQAVQAQAELLAKEKRATREAMQKALALQAEAREKIAQSEALLAQYGLADVPPQPTPPQKGAEATPEGEFGL